MQGEIWILATDIPYLLTQKKSLLIVKLDTTYIRSLQRIYVTKSSHN